MVFMWIYRGISGCTCEPSDITSLEKCRISDVLGFEVTTLHREMGKFDATVTQRRYHLRVSLSSAKTDKIISPLPHSL